MGATSTYGSWLSVALFFASLYGFLSASLWLFSLRRPPPPSMYSLLHPTVDTSSTSLLLHLVLFFPCSFDMARGSSSHRGMVVPLAQTQNSVGLPPGGRGHESSVDSYCSVTPLEIQTEMDWLRQMFVS
jgi:hypothetical protein